VRCGPRFLFFRESGGGQLFSHDGRWIERRLGSFLAKMETGKVEKGELEEPARLVEYSDVAQRIGVLLHPAEVTSVGSDKVKLVAGGLVYGKLDPDSGRVFVVPSEGEYIASSEFVPLRVDESAARPEFVRRLLLLPEVEAALGLLKSGKCHQRADLEKLFACRAPMPSLPAQDNFLAQTDAAWSEIAELARSIPSFQRIVDESLATVFDCSAPEVPSLGFASLATLSAGRTLRNGFRFLSMNQAFATRLASFGKTVALNSVAIVRGGKRLTKGAVYANDPTGFRYLRGSDIGDAKVQLDQMMWIHESDYRQIERFKVQDGDIALSIAGVVGKVAVLDGLGAAGATENVALLRMRDAESHRPAFMMYLLLSSFVQFQMRKEMSELRQQKLSLEKVRSLRIPVFPKLAEQDKALAQVQARFEQTHSIVEKLRSRKAEVDSALRAVVGIEEPDAPLDLQEVEIDEDIAYEVGED